MYVLRPATVVAGAVGGGPDNTAVPPTVVGTHPLSDDTDDTYAEAWFSERTVGDSPGTDGVTTTWPTTVATGLTGFMVRGELLNSTGMTGLAFRVDVFDSGDYFARFCTEAGSPNGIPSFMAATDTAQTLTTWELVIPFESDDAAPGLLAALAAGDLTIQVRRIQDDSDTPDFDLGIRVYEMSLTVDTAPVDLPCNTTVDLALGTAAQMGDDTGPFGEYTDGVIVTVDGDPDFWFNFELDPTKTYDITVTYDPTSPLDGGTRFVRAYALRPGHETEDHQHALDIGANAGGCAVLYNNGLFATGDIQTFTIGSGVDPGPGVDPDDHLPLWDDPTLGVVAGYTRLWFETANSGAVSAISITKACGRVIPTLRKYPLPLLRIYPAPQTIQRGLRRGPSAIT